MTRHKNNIGVLRLLLASSVIIGHAPEIMDGNRHREPLTLLFNTLSLGECAVDSFFLLSGYLIASSMFRTKNVWNYLGNRAARIYPAFTISYIICIVLVAPLLGERPWHFIVQTITNLFLLKPPPLYPSNIFGFGTIALNGAMWSISYEFKCYIIVAIFWSTGVLHHRRVMLCLSFLGLFASVISTFGIIPSSFDPWIPKGDLIIGSPTVFIRLFAIFAVGVTSFLYKTDLIRSLDWRVSIVAVTVLAAAMFERHFAELSFTLLGGYCIFWFALNAKIGIFQRINDGWDISYGMYLYGWPAAIYIIHFWPRVPILLLTVASLAIATLAGMASWFGIEKWVKDPFGKRISTSPALI